MAKSEDILESISKYETFINDVLKEDLRKIESHIQQVNAEISDLIQQKHALEVVAKKTNIANKEVHPVAFKTQVNIGSNFFMEATVKDTSKVLMHIGLNHYLEFTLLEAFQFLTIRIDAFERVFKEVQQKAAETKANIKFMLFGLGELYKQETNKENLN